MRRVVAVATIVLVVLSVTGVEASLLGTYADATTSNTDNAASPGSAWATTADSGTDGLWQYPQTSGHGSWDVFGNRDAVVAYGATEAAPTVATTIGGLTAANNYWTYVTYGSHSASNHSIRAGLAPASLSVYDNTARMATAGTLDYEGGYMNIHQGLLGPAAANSSGQVKAYVATNPAGNAAGRALYDGVSYVDAGSGPGIVGKFVEATTGNTANAAGGNWATATDSGTDGLWQIGGTSSHGSWDVFANRDAIQAYGGTESVPTLVTSITGLTAGSSYNVRLLFGSQTDQNQSIKAGLVLGSLAAYDLNNSSLAFSGTLLYENGYMNLRQALLGAVTADSSGQINVYVGANPLGTAGGRALYDGVSYELVPEPGALALIGTALVGLLAYAWRRRK